MKRNHVIARLLGPVVGASVLALAAAFAPQAGAVAMYDAQATGTLKLLGVENLSGAPVASGWAVSATRAITYVLDPPTDYIFGNASASAVATFTPPCTPGSGGDCAPVSLAVGGELTNSSRSQGQSGAPEGYAASLLETVIRLEMENTSNDALVFRFDWSAEASVTTKLDDPALELVDAIASVILTDLFDGGGSNLLLLAESTGGTVTSSPAKTCAPAGVSFDLGYLLCVQLARSKTAKVDMFVETFGLAVTEPSPAPTPATLPLMGLGLVGAAALRRRRRRLG